MVQTGVQWRLQIIRKKSSIFADVTTGGACPGEEDDRRGEDQCEQTTHSETCFGRWRSSDFAKKKRNTIEAMMSQRSFNFSIDLYNELNRGLLAESAWLIPCMVLVINDNLYGLMFALSYIYRCVHQLACSPFVGVKVKGRRKVCVDQGLVRVDHHSRPSEDMPKRASPILVYGGASSESSPKRNQGRWCILRR